MEGPPSRIRLVIELLAGRQPLSGQVIDREGEVIPFMGWLELAAAIERARFGQVDTAGPPGAGPG